MMISFSWNDSFEPVMEIYEVLFLIYSSVSIMGLDFLVYPVRR